MRQAALPSKRPQQDKKSPQAKPPKAIDLTAAKKAPLLIQSSSAKPNIWQILAWRGESANQQSSVQKYGAPTAMHKTDANFLPKNKHKAE